MFAELATPVQFPSQMRLTGRPRLLLGITGVLISLLAAPGVPVAKQLQTLPGSVARGERLLTTNGCLNCHSLKGEGGTRAPDLAVISS